MDHIMMGNIKIMRGMDKELCTIQTVMFMMDLGTLIKELGVANLLLLMEALFKLSFKMIK